MSLNRPLISWKTYTYAKERPQSTHRVAIADFMMEKSPLLDKGGGCTPAPFHSVYHHIKSCSERSSWEGRYTPLFHLQPICTLWLRHYTVLHSYVCRRRRCQLCSPISWFWGHGEHHWEGEETWTKLDLPSERDLCREYWMIYRRPGFLGVVRFVPSPLLSSASWLSFAVFVCFAGQATGEGGGEGPWS